MKLKRLPEDFEVEERTDVRPEPTGDFALYRLVKRGIGTPEAIDAVLRAWRLQRGRVSFGGLKDRHALTRQHVTVLHGPARDLRQPSFHLEYLGRIGRPFVPGDIVANGFRVVLRSLSRADEEAAVAALGEVATDGLPDYFDDQRFGSLGESGEWIGRAWVDRRYERVLWLGFADANPMDRPPEREAKRLLRERWGDWRWLEANLPPGPHRGLASFFAARPGDLVGALTWVRQDLRSLWLAAFQSHLFNRVLAAAVREVVPAERRRDVELKSGVVPFFGPLEPTERERLLGLELPLPSSRVRPEPGPVKDLVDRVLAEEGLTLRALDVKHPRGSFFSKGFRPAVVRPEGLVHETGDDDLYAGRRRLVLRFDLPRGAYATILVKRLTVAADLRVP